MEFISPCWNTYMAQLAKHINGRTRGGEGRICSVLTTEAKALLGQKGLVVKQRLCTTWIPFKNLLLFI